MVKINRQTLLNLKEVGLTRSQIAWVLQVCTRTLRRWMKPQQLHECIKPRGRPSKLKALDPEWIASLLRNNPYQSQRDLVHNISAKMSVTVHRSTVSRYLKRMKWTKKVPVRSALKSYEQKADNWLRTFQIEGHQGRLMALDETAFVVGKVGPGKGYAPLGERLVHRHNPRERKMFTLLVCIDQDSPSPVHSILVEGPITGTLFQEFIASMPAHLKGNTLILDNASIHHASKSLQQNGRPSIKDTAEERGLHLQYIPPYSPQCNPTELFFASLKKRVMKTLTTTSNTLQQVIKRELADGVWDTKGMFRHCFAWMM